MISNNEKQIEELSKELKKMYNVVIKGTEEIVDKATKSGAKEMRNWQGNRGTRPQWSYPKVTNGLKLAKFSEPNDWDEYFSSWKAHVEKPRYPTDSTNGVIYAGKSSGGKQKYSMVHLLENGHIVVSHGKPVAVTHAFPHVQPIYEYCNDLVDDLIKKELKNL